ncbi:uncharacterized protein TNCV_3622021 [Trichonephila clavipes]|nr:uncharacterized protein TNCV_3622021 [Trichonephila clavipes]
MEMSSEGVTKPFHVEPKAKIDNDTVRRVLEPMMKERFLKGLRQTAVFDIRLVWTCHSWKAHSGSDTWCKYQKAKQEGKLYKHRTTDLANAVFNTVKTTYMDLCDQSLLEKRLHGKTQNANESFNGVLWSIIPKETFVELLTLQFGVFLAVLQFNDGSKGILSVLEYLHIPMGYFILKRFSKTFRYARASHVELSSPPPTQGGTPHSFVAPAGISSQSSRHYWRSPLPHASALIQKDFGCVLGVQQTKQLPHVVKVDLVWQLGV